MNEIMQLARNANWCLLPAKTPVTENAIELLKLVIPESVSVHKDFYTIYTASLVLICSPTVNN